MHVSVIWRRVERPEVASSLAVVAHLVPRPAVSYVLVQPTPINLVSRRRCASHIPRRPHNYDQSRDAFTILLHFPVQREGRVPDRLRMALWNE